MSLTQDRFMIMFWESNSNAFNEKIAVFLVYLSIELGLLYVVWTVMSYVPQKYINKVLKYFSVLIALPTSMEKIRIFYFIFVLMKKQDPRLTMIVSIAFAFGPELVEKLAANLFNNRAASKYTNNSTLFYESLIFVVEYQLLLRKKQISALFCFPSNSLALQYINFVLPIYYIYIFLKK